MPSSRGGGGGGGGENVKLHKLNNLWNSPLLNIMTGKNDSTTLWMCKLIRALVVNSLFEGPVQLT